MLIDFKFHEDNHGAWDKIFQIIESSPYFKDEDFGAKDKPKDKSNKSKKK